MFIVSRALYTILSVGIFAVLSIPLMAHANYNTPTGQLYIITETTGGYTGSATVSVQGNGVSLLSYPSNTNALSYTSNFNNDSRMVTMNAGTYSVSLPTDGYRYSYSGSCTGYMSQGESKTCTITMNGNGNSTGNYGNYSGYNGYFDNNGIWHSYDTDCFNGAFYNTCGTCNTYGNNNCNSTANTARVNVMVNVINAYGGTRTAGDFVITVSGSGVTSRTFNGSKNQVQVSLSSGTYTIDAQSTKNYSVARSANCSGSISANETRSCIITLSDRNTYQNGNYNGGTHYNPNANYNYGANTLSCQAAATTVGVGQTATFSAIGGSGPYTWVTRDRSYYAVGPQLNVVLLQPGAQTVSVSNGYQTATCAITVVHGGAGVVLGTQYPGLPNTGYAPTNLGLILSLLGAFVAFPAALYVAYAYAKRGTRFA